VKIDENDGGEFIKFGEGRREARRGNNDQDNNMYCIFNTINRPLNTKLREILGCISCSGGQLCSDSHWVALGVEHKFIIAVACDLIRGICNKYAHQPEPYTIPDGKVNDQE
jgi:hypothetical protein